jgi:SulP family sulfate permease
VSLRERVRGVVTRETLGSDAAAGLVLGVESVPDGLAGGLLAGVNPVYGLYAYLVGTFTGAVFTSSSMMAVQATGAMAVLVADVRVVHEGSDPSGALFTLSVLTGVVMVAAGLLKLGGALRFVSNAVMVGFISAVGVNIVLGQLDNLTGYTGEGSNRVIRALDHIGNLTELSLASILVGAVTIVLIVVLERTRLGALGMVVAIVVTSGAVWALNLDVEQLRAVTDVPRSLPVPQMPALGMVPELLVPALSLAFIGLVQGAGISANFPDADGSFPDVSRDFVGQGAANVASGVFQGMPVGGSMSATSLVASAGAKSRLALFIASLTMAVVILLFGEVAGYIAMPALAGLLMVVGVRTVKFANLRSVWKTGWAQATVLTVTFALTLVMALQYAVLVGVGISAVLFIVGRSNKVTVRRWILEDANEVIEVDPPAEVPAGDVVVLEPYGSLFFASAPAFEAQLPKVTDASGGSVVILRLRGRTDIGSTFTDVIKRYATSLRAAGSKLVLVSLDDRLVEQLRASHVTDVVPAHDIYASGERVGAGLRRAHDDSLRWCRDHGAGAGGAA